MKGFVDFVIVVTGYSFESLEHMGVSYIKAYLRQNEIDSKIHVVFPEEIEQVAERFADRSPELIGLPMFAGNVQVVEQTAEILKKSFPNAHLTVGGPTPLNQAENILKHAPFIDSAVVGEGEYTFLELAERIFAGDDLGGCLGVTYRAADGQIVVNPHRPLITNLDELPFPERDIFEMYPATFLRMVGARGCLGACTFCDGAGKPLQDGPWVRSRTAKNIVDEMEYLYKKYEIASFQFIDPTFEDPYEEGKAKAEGFIRELKERQLPVGFVVSTRAEKVTLETMPYLRELNDVGLESIYIGLEAGNEHDLRLYAKRAKMEDNIRAIRLIKEADIYLSFGFINFNPYSTYETILQNAEFLYENGLGYMLWTFLTKLEVYPAAAIMRKLKRDGLMDPDADYRTGIHAYQFKEPAIGELVDSLGKIDTHLSQVLLDTKIGMLSSRVKRQFTGEKAASFQKIFDDVKDLRERQNEKNYTFFKECVELSKNGASKEELDAFCQSFNNSNSYDELNNLYWKLCLKLGRSK